MVQRSAQMRYALRSSNELLLNRPSFKSLATLGDRSFTVAAPSLWNSLPKEIRCEDNFYIFKTMLKTYLLNLAFN